MTSETLSQKYRGRPEVAHRKFNRQAKKLARDGWTPISQHYEEGRWGIFAFLVALLLSVVIIGILAFIYMLLVRPKSKGALYVTYERVLEEEEDYWEEGEDLKSCPDCAESVKPAANVCRYCGYRFDQMTNNF